MATAQLRSRAGNHSATALPAAGQFADSPKPNKNRKKQRLRRPITSDVSMATTEYQATVNVRPRRVPTRSIKRPVNTCPSA